MITLSFSGEIRHPFHHRLEALGPGHCFADSFPKDVLDLNVVPEQHSQVGVRLPVFEIGPGATANPVPNQGMVGSCLPRCDVMIASGPGSLPKLVNNNSGA